MFSGARRSLNRCGGAIGTRLDMRPARSFSKPGAVIMQDVPKDLGQRIAEATRLAVLLHVQMKLRLNETLDSVEKQNHLAEFGGAGLGVGGASLHSVKEGAFARAAMSASASAESEAA